MAEIVPLMLARLQRAAPEREPIFVRFNGEELEVAYLTVDGEPWTRVYHPASNYDRFYDGHRKWLRVALAAWGEIHDVT